MTHIENNIELIKEVLIDGTYKSNIFQKTPKTTYPEQVLTPHFKERNGINFESQKIIHDQIKKPEKILEEELPEPKKKANERFPDSFNSFQEKHESSNHSDFLPMNGNTTKRKEPTYGSDNSSKEKAHLTSQDPTVSDVIVSDKNLKMTSEKDTVKGSVQEKKELFEDRFDEVITADKEYNEGKRTKKDDYYNGNYRSKRYNKTNNRRYYRGYNKYQYKDDEHYYY